MIGPHNKRYRDLLSDRTVFVNIGNNFHKIHVVSNLIETSLEDLNTTQEEADTKVFLCCAHACENGFDSVLISTVDSDIALYALYFKEKVGIPLYVQIGSKNKKRILDISAIYETHGELLCSALPALHAFTGNDYTSSSFHGVGKAKAFKIINKSDEYKILFASFGNSFTFEASLFPKIEEFVCELYGLPTCTNTDKAWYIKFCSSKNRLSEPQQLPHTRDALLCHCKRVSYVTAIIKASLTRCPKIPSPEGNGWYLKDVLEVDDTKTCPRCHS